MPPQNRGASRGPSSGAGTRKVGAKGRAKAEAPPDPDDPAVKLETEAREMFERYEPDGKVEGSLRLQQFAQCIRDVNVEQGMLWGEEPGPIVKQEWGNLDGFKKREIKLVDFQVWWPSFKQAIQQRREERESAEREEKEAMEARYSGDGVWRVPLVQLKVAMDKAREKGKTPLLIDNTEAQRVETFFLYDGACIIEGKKMVVEKAKGASIEDILKEARDKLFSAKCFRFGQTAVFRLGNAAPDFRKTFCSETFPALALMDTQEVLKVTGPENSQNFGSSPFAKMCPDSDSLMECRTMGVHEKFRVVVITQFQEENYKEFLEEMVPLELMQPIKPEVS